MAEKDLYKIFIEKFVLGGFGLGRLENGIVVLVRHVLPGEKVLVRAVGRKKDYVSGMLKEVLASSPDRIEPPCPVYGRCGGCDLQHAGPAAQLGLKKAILADTLQRGAANIFNDLQGAIEAPVAAPQQFGYRQRIRLQVDRKGACGFFRPGSHLVVPVAECLLARKELNTVLGQLRSSALFSSVVKHCRAFELLFNPDGNDTVLLLHYRRKPRPTDCLLAVELADKTGGLASVLLQVEGYGLYDPLTQTFPATPPILSATVTIAAIQTRLCFSWEVGGFSQVNPAQNSNLIKLVLEMAAGSTHDRILDLYCGYGNFSLPVARPGGEVLGIDGQNAAIRSARRNARQNNITNCRFVKSPVPAAVRSLTAEHRTFATIILDPPRQGAPEIISLLPDLDADRIIYISCNPATLARDLAALVSAGYQVTRLVPVDMFPQTHHLESVALLKRQPDRNRCGV